MSDKPKAHVLSRRETLTYLGAAGAVALIGCGDDAGGGPGPSPDASGGTPDGSSGADGAPDIDGSTPAADGGTSADAPTSFNCVARPSQTEGPYFVDEMLNRSDIRTDPSDGTRKPGTPLRLKIGVYQSSGGSCAPVVGAVVDIWQCDAAGVYSDVVDPNAGSTRGKKFLRGYQLTNSAGEVEFLTIYPGWYPGRTVHIHFKVRTDPDSQQGLEFTSQMYFDDSFTDDVFTQPPYSSRGPRTTRNQADGIFRQGGDDLMLDVHQAATELVTRFDIGLED